MPTWPASMSPPMPVSSPEITKASKVSRRLSMPSRWLASGFEPTARKLRPKPVRIQQPFGAPPTMASVSATPAGSNQSGNCAASEMASSIMPAAVGRSSSDTPCRPMKVAIVTTIAGRRSEVISRPCSRPKTDGEQHDEDRARRRARGRRRRRARETRRATTQKPGERADRQVDGADENGGELRARQEGEDAEERQHALDAERRQEIAVQRLRAADDDRGEHREHQRGKMVARQELVSAPAGAPRGGRARARHGRGEIGFGDGRVGDCSARELIDDAAAGEDQHAIAEAFELDAVGGGDQHRHALIGKRAQALVDFAARADVDALGRLVDQEHRRLRRDLASEQRLLLIAAGQFEQLAIRSTRRGCASSR